MTLATYLDAVTRQRHDCCTFMADWLVANGFSDPMTDRRGTYATARQYKRLIALEGGIEASCARRFARIGLRETSTPHAGDLAIVRAPVGKAHGVPIFGATGAICTSETMRAVVAVDMALAIAELPTVRAWSFHG